MGFSGCMRVLVCGVFGFVIFFFLSHSEIYILTSRADSHRMVSESLFSLLAFLEPGQFAAVEDLIFFLEGHASINCSCFPKEKKQSFFPFCNLPFSFMVLFKGHNILARSKCRKGFE